MGNAQYRFSSPVDRCVFAGSKYAEGVRMWAGSDITPRWVVSADAYIGENVDEKSSGPHPGGTLQSKNISWRQEEPNWSVSPNQFWFGVVKYGGAAKHWLEERLGGWRLSSCLPVERDLRLDGMKSFGVKVICEEADGALPRSVSETSARVTLTAVTDLDSANVHSLFLAMQHEQGCCRSHLHLARAQGAHDFRLDLGDLILLFQGC